VSVRDTLQPPSPYDPTAAAYKDWLHLNVFDFRDGNIAIVNASLHGAPADPRSLAVGLALVRSPEHGWLGEMESGPRADAAIWPAGIGLERMALALGAGGDVLADARALRSPLELQLHTTPVTRAIDAGARFPLGGGWIAWRAVPRLGVRGRYAVGEHAVDVGRTAAYHDHNWGRWFWGDDFGWEWGAFLTPDDATFVFAVVTDRTHRRRGHATFTLDAGGRRRTWTDAQVRIAFAGRLDGVARRLPGALAALHQDRAHPALPRTVTIQADDGVDRIELQFEAESAVQLITADPAVRGYSFIHELAGDFFYRGTVQRRPVEGWGMGVFEHVD
jgi:hypothetical protein